MGKHQSDEWLMIDKSKIFFPKWVSIGCENVRPKFNRINANVPYDFRAFRQQKNAQFIQKIYPSMSECIMILEEFFITAYFEMDVQDESYTRIYDHFSAKAHELRRAGVIIPLCEQRIITASRAQRRHQHEPRGRKWVKWNEMNENLRTRNFYLQNWEN